MTVLCPAPSHECHRAVTICMGAASAPYRAVAFCMGAAPAPHRAVAICTGAAPAPHRAVTICIGAAPAPHQSVAICTGTASAVHRATVVLRALAPGSGPSGGAGRSGSADSQARVAWLRHPPQHSFARRRPWLGRPSLDPTADKTNHSL